MGKILSLVLANFAGSAIKKLLLGAGLGIATGAIVLTVLNFYIGKVQQQAGLLGDMAGIAHLGGLDVALSIIIGAVVVRATLQATKIFVTKAGS